MKDDALTECPECTAEVSRIVTGGSGTIFKGADWADKKVKWEYEDNKLMELSRKVKDKKIEGDMPMNEHVLAKDATKIGNTHANPGVPGKEVSPPKPSGDSE